MGIQRPEQEKTHLPTGGQTVGPFFAFGIDYPKKHEVVFPHSPGSVLLGGFVHDGAGAPLAHGLQQQRAHLVQAVAIQRADDRQDQQP